MLAELDSRVVVELMSHSSKEDGGLATLVLDCLSLATEIPFICFMHIPRKGNWCADFLANLGQNVR